MIYPADGYPKMTLDAYAAIAEAYVAEKSSIFRRLIESPTFEAALGRLDGRSVLDLACGGGQYARLAKHLGAGRVVGVDISEQMLAIAQRLEQEQPLGITYVRGDVLSLDIPEQSAFDVVIAAYLLNHAETQEALAGMLRTIARSLRPEGRFVALVAAVELRSDEALAAASFRRIGSWGGGDGDRYTFSIGEGEARFEITNTHWSQRTYDRLLQDAGLCEIAWADRATSFPEALSLAEHDPAVALLLASPPFRLLTAVRSARSKDSIQSDVLGRARVHEGG